MECREDRGGGNGKEGEWRGREFVPQEKEKTWSLCLIRAATHLEVER